MTNVHLVRSTLATAMFIGGGIVLAPNIASAHEHPRDFSSTQHALEVQLASRVSQLARLQSDVSSAKTLTAAHEAALTARITTTTANINALVSKVPSDTTYAQLRADRSAMIKQNRVFAVLTPQVFLTIEADAITAQVTTLQGEESGLISAVNGLVGQHGYKNAFNRYTAFAKSVNAASLDASNIVNAVLNQVPSDFPRDTGVFVRSNRALLRANITLAHANYDASVVGLAAGGYTGA